MSAVHKYLHLTVSGSYLCRLMNVKERDIFMEASLALRKVTFSLIFLNRHICIVEMRCVSCEVHNEF
jgi:hypothetical protein